MAGQKPKVKRLSQKTHSLVYRIVELNKFSILQHYSIAITSSLLQHHTNSSNNQLPSTVTPATFNNHSSNKFLRPALSAMAFKSMCLNVGSTGETRIQDSNSYSSANIAKVPNFASLEKKMHWTADSLATTSAKSPSTFCSSVWAVLILSVMKITNRMRTAQTELQKDEGDLAEAVARLSLFQCVFFSSEAELRTLASMQSSQFVSLSFRAYLCL